MRQKGGMSNMRVKGSFGFTASLRLACVPAMFNTSLTCASGFTCALSPSRRGEGHRHCAAGEKTREFCAGGAQRESPAHSAQDQDAAGHASLQQGSLRQQSAHCCSLGCLLSPEADFPAAACAWCYKFAIKRASRKSANLDRCVRARACRTWQGCESRARVATQQTPDSDMHAGRPCGATRSAHAARTRSAHT